MKKLSRRQWLGTTSAGALWTSVAQEPAAAQQAGPSLHRTQFDDNLLAEIPAPPVPGNQGRQMLATADGAVLTALAWVGGVLRIWRDRAAVAQHNIPSGASSPILLEGQQGNPTLWISAAGRVARAREWASPPEDVERVRGELLDAAAMPDGRTVLALSRSGLLSLTAIGKGSIEETVVDQGAGRASLDFDPAGYLHLVFEKRQGIEYRRYDANHGLRNASLVHAERAAEAYGFHPVVMAHGGRVLLSYRGESVRIDTPHSGGAAWDRLGRGGYIAVLVSGDNGWRRVRVADSRQIVKTLYPINGAYGGGADRDLLVRYEEFSPPALALGPDGVVVVLWCDLERRWIYGSRLLGDDFAPAMEVRGPVEQLAADIAPRRVPEPFAGVPLAMVGATRVYLERVALPGPVVSRGRRIDFVTPDDLAVSRGLETRVNQMRRHPRNPVIPVDPPGGPADGAVVAHIRREPSGWRAEIKYITVVNADPNTPNRGWRCDGVAVSADGVEWKKMPPQPLAQRYTVNGSGEHKETIRYVEDPQERNPAWRYKGFWRSVKHEPWGYLPVVSPDAVRWTTVETGAIVRADDDLRVWIDRDDVPQRRFKADAISRSFCGRVCAQWISADGVHWNDIRETLDFRNPFGAPPDRGSTGRILLDSWSGSDDEDEIHGGVVFRDGDRWLLHYMKWSADGHIQCALAASRDGLNFARVGGGKPTLPLGEAGTWDAGRVALREAPFLVGDVWRQYYTGCGWKHGMGGIGARTSHFGLNAPNQQGLAEIPAGRWAHLELARDADAGELASVPLQLVRPHRLTVDVEGLGGSNTLSCAVLDAHTGAALAGFAHEECDAVGNGRAVPVTWGGRGLETAGTRRVCLAVRMAGMRVKLFGMNLA
ncbi:MAG: hypothetical protein ABSH05_26575 [Bryobacteraceae bacterium]|jgi:hypothetical protein